MDYLDSFSSCYLIANMKAITCNLESLSFMHISRLQTTTAIAILFSCHNNETAPYIITFAIYSSVRQTFLSWLNTCQAHMIMNKAKQPLQVLITANAIPR